MNEESKKVTMTFEIPEGLKKRFKIHCVRIGSDMGEKISSLIMNELTKRPDNDNTR